MTDPASAAEAELDNGRPDRALVYAVLAVALRLKVIDDTLTDLVLRPFDT